MRKDADEGDDEDCWNIPPMKIQHVFDEIDDWGSDYDEEYKHRKLSEYFVKIGVQ